jgi:hypothetical protein
LIRGRLRVGEGWMLSAADESQHEMKRWGQACQNPMGDLPVSSLGFAERT